MLRWSVRFKPTMLWFSKTGEKPIASIADYGSLRDSVFAVMGVE